MADEQPRNDDLEPGESGPVAGRGPGHARPAHLQPSPGVEPLPLEDDEDEIDLASDDAAAPKPGAAPRLGRATADEPPRKSTVKDLDVCPNCGASMRDTTSLVCLRCGFDMKTNKVLRTATGETTAGSGEDEAEPAPALVQPGNGDLWLPGALAGVAGVILVISYLAGASALFPQLDAAARASGQPLEVGVGDRLVGLLRTAVLLAMWAACGLGALAFIAQLLGNRLVAEVAHLKLAALRVLAIVAVARLAALVNIASATGEWILESVLALAFFMGLAMALFRLHPRDAATYALSTLILFLLLWLGAHAVLWATAG